MWVRKKDTGVRFGAIVRKAILAGFLGGMVGGFRGALKFSIKYDFLNGFVFFFIGGFILFFLIGLAGFFPFERGCLCATCFKAQRPNSNMKCQCGGLLEPISNWEWKPDADEKKHDA